MSAEWKKFDLKDPSTRYTVDGKAWKYLFDYGWTDDEHCSKLRAETAKHQHAFMCSAAEETSLFRILLKSMGAKKCVEVGVFTGHGTLVLAQEIPADGKVVAFDVDEEAANIGKPFWEKAGVASKIDLRIGDAVAGLDKLIEEDNGARSFDFAFIDADKPNYLSYVEQCAKLVRVGGIIALDNTLWQLKILQPAEEQDERTKCIQKVNEFVASNPDRWEHSMLAMGDGVTLLCLKK
eukprot:TRINITY_DN39410_c0_g1_i1.p1 TRINITY_DN39410_c0_g1~~TRINITY_DN39410_c0_g1_i1.p1  ORF type:complete len:276 (+),score=47.91 TRINITY_DN39410_c0_g1_i1:121-828(+)